MTVAVAACGGDPVGMVACTDNIVPGIRATALNASSNADITSGAYLVATEGTYRDSVGPGLSVLSAAAERTGIYTVRIGHPGYFAFIRNNVVVAKDECHVIPVVLQVKLIAGGGGPN
ncbi:MAG: hypothetical protein ACR2L6_02405 [Gemmatimonadaceae bacterium]